MYGEHTVVAFLLPSYGCDVLQCCIPPFRKRMRPAYVKPKAASMSGHIAWSCQVNGSTLLGAGGELSDFAYIAKLLDELVTEDFVADDGIKLSAPEVHAYLTRVMYNRRNKCAH